MEEHQSRVESALTRPLSDRREERRSRLGAMEARWPLESNRSSMGGRRASRLPNPRRIFETGGSNALELGYVSQGIESSLYGLWLIDGRPSSPIANDLGVSSVL